MKRTTQEKLREHLFIDKKKSISKITIAGVGQVGTACAYSIMQQVMPSLINIDLTVVDRFGRFRSKSIDVYFLH